VVVLRIILWFIWQNLHTYQFISCCRSKL
jgi:hypothetical protein